MDDLPTHTFKTDEGDVALKCPADERNLVIHGFLTFLDPPKETAGPAIAALQEIGVAVKVLTGVNAVVTRTICRCCVPCAAWCRRWADWICRCWWCWCCCRSPSWCCRGSSSPLEPGLVFCTGRWRGADCGPHRAECKAYRSAGRP